MVTRPDQLPEQVTAESERLVIGCLVAAGVSEIAPGRLANISFGPAIAELDKVRLVSAPASWQSASQILVTKVRKAARLSAAVSAAASSSPIAALSCGLPVE